MKKAFLKFWNWGWGIYHKNEEAWNYLIFGFLGVIVSIGSYTIFLSFNIHYQICNIISWIMAVLFMYLTNKFFVFKSKCSSILELGKEFILFISARLLTLGVETIILYAGIDMMHINNIVIKVIAQVIIIALNYVLSKIIIFKKNNK